VEAVGVVGVTVGTGLDVAVAVAVAAGSVGVEVGPGRLVRVWVGVGVAGTEGAEFLKIIGRWTQAMGVSGLNVGVGVLVVVLVAVGVGVLVVVPVAVGVGVLVVVLVAVGVGVLVGGKPAPEVRKRMPTSASNRAPRSSHGPSLPEQLT
jgi:hypothetical protein